ncbi:MAG TPA: hypothetical protein VNA25_02680 [Phycisphaerae bacterium]|nr:hypothetical protein [Phycisphaerae bacterium]
MRGCVAIICVSAAIVAATADVKLVEDPPLVRAPADGNVSGVITPPEKVSRVKAVSRTTRKVYPAAAFDAKTGKFLFRGLPGDATYDVSVTTTDGRTIEGIDLSAADSRLASLAEKRRRQLGMPPARTHKFDGDDANALLEYVRDMEDFMDIRRALYVQGHGKYATVLVEMIRTAKFYAAKSSEMIWRIELWHFQYSYGGWERIPNTERVLQRLRLPQAEWRKIHVEYYPQLSVYVDPVGFAKSVAFKLPDKPDASRGRPPNTDPELKTKAHVSGLDVKDEPASRPARQPAGS